MRHSSKTYRRLIASNQWASLRRRKLTEQPLCERCKAEGRLTCATEVHHIVPVESEAGELRQTALLLDYSNLMAVCHSCHMELHKSLGKGTRVQAKERTHKAVDEATRRLFGDE